MDSSRNISDEQWEKIREVEKTKDVFGLNKLLQIEEIQLKSESIFHKEVARFLRGNNYDFSQNSGGFHVNLSDGASVKISNNDTLYSNCTFTEQSREEYLALGRYLRGIYEYCSDYEKAAPLKAEGLSGNYRCLAEFNSTVLATKYNEEYGIEFVTWGRTYDGKSLWHGNYYSDYDAAKKNFAVRSGADRQKQTVRHGGT